MDTVGNLPPAGWSGLVEQGGEGGGVVDAAQPAGGAERKPAGHWETLSRTRVREPNAGRVTTT